MHNMNITNLNNIVIYRTGQNTAHIVDHIAYIAYIVAHIAHIVAHIVAFCLCYT